jgi:citrate lyase subunit beta/citryl-CoA lyase
LLFLPIKLVEKAPATGADAIILDLEDAVAPNAKDAVRAQIPAAAERLVELGMDVTVRINRPWRLAAKDLEVAVCPSVTALLLPMTDTAAHVKEIDQVVSEIEAEKGMTPGHTLFCPLIETAEGYLKAREIAHASPRMMSLSLGSEDFSLSMGMDADPETLYAPKQQIIACARAAGVTPMGFIGSIAEFNDNDKLIEIFRRSKRAGFRMASCIHPKQVKVCNDVYGPSEAEIAQARKIVDAYDVALAAGEGAITVDGIMVDVPVADRARATLAFAAALAAR